MLWSFVIALHDKQVSYKIHRSAHHLGTTYSIACFILGTSLASAISCDYVFHPSHGFLRSTPQSSSLHGRVVSVLSSKVQLCTNTRLRTRLCQSVLQGQWLFCSLKKCWTEQDQPFSVVGGVCLFSWGNLCTTLPLIPTINIESKLKRLAHQFYFSSQQCVGLFLNINTFISHAILCLIAFMIIFFFREEPQTRMGRA